MAPEPEVGVGGIRRRARRCYGTGSLPVMSVLSTLANLTNYTLTAQDLSLSLVGGVFYQR